jgi:aryl-alcohol dehydrogenase-like predicted oxidoreductase
MNYRPLGRTGLQVSPLCFGTMAFGGDADAAEAARMYRAGRDAASTSSTPPTSTTPENRKRSSAS